jgi:hypothetical protein
MFLVDGRGCVADVLEQVRWSKGIFRVKPYEWRCRAGRRILSLSCLETIGGSVARDAIFRQWGLIHTIARDVARNDAT